MNGIAREFKQKVLRVRSEDVECGLNISQYHLRKQVACMSNLPPAYAGATNIFLSLSLVSSS